MQGGDASLLPCDKVSKQTVGQVTADFISKGRWHRLGDVLRLLRLLCPGYLVSSSSVPGMSGASQLLSQREE